MVDGSLLQEWDTKGIIESNGDLSFNIPSLNNRRSLQMIYTDAAGNVGATEIKKLLVTSNKLVKYNQNTKLFYGSIGGISIVAFYVFSRFRRNPKVCSGKIEQ